MNVASLSSMSPALPGDSQVTSSRDEALFRAGAPAEKSSAQGAKDAKLAEAARQFEGVLVRQILSESMKSMLEDGASGQVYGYYLNDTISDSVTKGGGLGLASVFQAQIAGQKGTE
jgi:Rod binding domain-containing protein